VIVLDASVALKWFVEAEPLKAEASSVLEDIERDPRPYLVPELFMNEMLAVLARMSDASAERLGEALSLIERLGLTRIGNGHELMQTAAAMACRWGLSGYDATYVALASLTGSVWLTADKKAAKRVPRGKGLVRVLGR